MSGVVMDEVLCRQPTTVHVHAVSRSRFVLQETTALIEVLPRELDAGCYCSCFGSGNCILRIDLDIRTLDVTVVFKRNRAIDFAMPLGISEL